MERPTLGEDEDDAGSVAIETEEHPPPEPPAEPEPAEEPFEAPVTEQPTELLRLFVDHAFSLLGNASA